MKNGTMYAVRLKKAYKKWCKSVTDIQVPETDDPLRRLGIAILGVGVGDEIAERGIDRALETMVDWNEIRVSNAHELNIASGNMIARGTERCQRLINALQSIFDSENRLSLEHLKRLGLREARHYLEELNGVDEYTVASVILWSLEGHAIPVDDRLLQALHGADLIHESANRAEVQAFLERHINASQAKEFCVAMRSFGGTKRSTPAGTKKTPKAKKTNSVSKSK